MDVLMQHMINCCMGSSYTKADLLAMCHATATYRKLTITDLTWVLIFAVMNTLFCVLILSIKLIREDDSYLTNTAPLIQKSQRFGVGTITSDDFLFVKFSNQKRWYH